MTCNYTRKKYKNLHTNNSCLMHANFMENKKKCKIEKMKSVKIDIFRKLKILICFEFYADSESVFILFL
jgi:hypothetical protein